MPSASEVMTAKPRANPIARDTFVTTALGVVGRATNLIVPFLVGAWFGMKMETDVLFIALAFLVFCTGVFAWAIEAVMVPFVAKLRHGNTDGVGTFVGGLISVLGLGLAFLLPLLILARPVLGRLTNFSGQALHLLCLLLVELAPVLLMVTVSSVLSGTLNAYQIFWAPAISTAISLVATACVAYISKDALGIHAVVLGFVVGEGSRLLFLWQVLRRYGIGSVRFTWHMEPQVREFLKVSSYQIGGMCIAGLPPLVNRSIASYWGAGSVSLVEYAEKMSYIPAGILSSGFLTVILSHWAKDFHEGGLGRLRSQVHRMAKLIGCLACIAAVILFAFRYPLASLALGWGKVPQEKIVEVGQLFGVYVLGLLPNVVGLVLGRGHLVMKNTNVLMQGSVVAVAVLLLLNLGLTPLLGLRAIAVANAGSQGAVCLYLFWTLRKPPKIQEF